MQSLLFWDIPPRRFVFTDLYLYLPMFLDNLSGPILKEQGTVWTIGCLETSVDDYQFTLRNIPEERRSHRQKPEIMQDDMQLTSEKYFDGSKYWIDIKLIDF
jgi:hypothetical protein